MKDRELIHRIQNGEKQYLNTVAEKYYDDIYYFCSYQIGSRDDAYDLAQETFLRFIRYVEQYRYKNLKGYLLTIAMNVCRNYFRGRGSSKTVSIEELDGERRMMSKDVPELDFTVMAAEGKEQIEMLEKALLMLNNSQRESILLHHFYGYKNREIAHMTGASYGAVKSSINQGLAKLQRILKKEDFYG